MQFFSNPFSKKNQTRQQDETPPIEPIQNIESLLTKNLYIEDANFLKNNIEFLKQEGYEVVFATESSKLTDRTTHGSKIFSGIDFHKIEDTGIEARIAQDISDISAKNKKWILCGKFDNNLCKKLGAAGIIIDQKPKKRGILYDQNSNIVKISSNSLLLSILANRENSNKKRTENALGDEEETNPASNSNENHNRNSFNNNTTGFEHNKDVLEVTKQQAFGQESTHNDSLTETNKKEENDTLLNKPNPEDENKNTNQSGELIKLFREVKKNKANNNNNNLFQNSPYLNKPSNSVVDKTTKIKGENSEEFKENDTSAEIARQKHLLSKKENYYHPQNPTFPSETNHYYEQLIQEINSAKTIEDTDKVISSYSQGLEHTISNDKDVSEDVSIGSADNLDIEQINLDQIALTSECFDAFLIALANKRFEIEKNEQITKAQAIIAEIDRQLTAEVPDLQQEVEISFTGDWGGEPLVKELLEKINDAKDLKSLNSVLNGYRKTISKNEADIRKAISSIVNRVALTSLASKADPAINYGDLCGTLLTPKNFDNLLQAFATQKNVLEIINQNNDEKTRIFFSQNNHRNKYNDIESDSDDEETNNNSSTSVSDKDSISFTSDKSETSNNNYKNIENDSGDENSTKSETSSKNYESDSEESTTGNKGLSNLLIRINSQLAFGGQGYEKAMNELKNEAGSATDLDFNANTQILIRSAKNEQYLETIFVEYFEYIEGISDLIKAKDESLDLEELEKGVFSEEVFNKFMRALSNKHHSLNTSKSFTVAGRNDSKTVKNGEDSSITSDNSGSLTENNKDSSIHSHPSHKGDTTEPTTPEESNKKQKHETNNNNNNPSNLGSFTDNQNHGGPNPTVENPEAEEFLKLIRPKGQPQTASVFAGSGRGNKFRVICDDGKAIYDEKAAITRMNFAVIALANKYGFDNAKLNVMAEFLRLNGGFSNKFDKSKGAEGGYDNIKSETLEGFIKQKFPDIDPEAEAKEWRKFSGELQEYNAKIGIYTGREENAKNPKDGLRSGFVFDLIRKMPSDEDILTKAKSAKEILTEAIEQVNNIKQALKKEDRSQIR